MILTIKLSIIPVLGYALCRLTRKENALESIAAVLKFLGYDLFTYRSIQGNKVIKNYFKLWII